MKKPVKDYLQLPPKVTRVGDTVYIDYRGSQVRSDRPLTLDCDCCGQRAWALTCHQLWPCCIEPLNDPRLRCVMAEEQYWGACLRCEPIFDNPVLMAARLADCLLPHQANDARIIAYFEWLHTGIVQAQTGVVLLWASGDTWPPK